jgi:large subunit ribosomal protein L28
MALCEICNKKTNVGNKVSHANKKSKRSFGSNLQKIKVADGEATRRAYVCTRCIKSNKVVKAV